MQTINNIIADAIAAQMTESEDSFSIQVEVDENTIVEVTGRYEMDSYCDDDYFNGTGAWTTTGAYVSIDDCIVCDSDGEEITDGVSLDVAVIEKLVAQRA